MTLRERAVALAARWTAYCAWGASSEGCGFSDAEDAWLAEAMRDQGPDEALCDALERTAPAHTQVGQGPEEEA